MTAIPIPHIRQRPPTGRLLLYAATSLLLVFLVAPILVVFPLSLSSGELLVLPTPGYSWRWYADFFTALSSAS
jgi:putative spermidine/putrescine transport system permease protein